MTATAGWFGKIPAFGDFASRRLPQEFIDAWDLWLQHGMAASRASLGNRWLESYLTAPIWYFGLFPGVIGTQAWTGLMMPSIDKVGRHFPLTIAMPLDPDQATVVAAFEHQEWYAGLGQIALSTLNLDFPADRLETDLDANPFPANGRHRSSAESRRLADWWQGDAPEFTSVFESPPPSGNILAAAGHCLLDAAGKGRSLWWHHSVDGWPQVVHGFLGLPPDARFESLLDEA